MRVTRAFPIVVSGPSGVGKTTLVGGLIGRVPNLQRSVSATTRPLRGGEVQGQSYFFVGKEEFENLKRGKLIEWAKVHGHFYGTPRDFVEETLEKGIDVVLSIDVQGGREVKKSFPEAVMVFILPPSFEILEQRIMRRAADLAEDIETRMANARDELRALPEYEYVVVNDELDRAIAALRAIVVSERCRRARYPEGYSEPFERGAAG
jgi:guanylate kinase